jgi:hypothetical protein
MDFCKNRKEKRKQKKNKKRTKKEQKKVKEGRGKPNGPKPVSAPDQHRRVLKWYAVAHPSR